MFDIIGIIGLLFSAKEIIAEKSERKQDTTYFNWDEYWDDVQCGMTTEQQLKKRQSGGYTTTSPCFSNNKKIVFDNDRYNHDKTLYGEVVAEMWKQNGSYNIRR